MSDFDHSPYSGQLPKPGGITFVNKSSGSFTNLSWSFGDDQYSSNSTAMVTHFYEQSGVYEVCLTVWDDNDCNSIHCEDVVIDLNNGSCIENDCVYPGDVNLDGVANVYDMIPLGIGVGASGPPRLNPSLDFAPQPALDWDQTTPDGINYKHLDCDGDGLIETEDLLAIQVNYSAVNDRITVFESDGPEVYLDFESDTIVINESTPEYITIKAGVYLGTEANQLDDLQGVAMALSYDSAFVADDGVEFEYNDNSFLGGMNVALPFGLDQRLDQQLDLGVSRVDQRTAKGYGRVATISFIIISDVIEVRTSNPTGVDFSVPIAGIKLTDGNGNEIEASIRKLAAKVTFLRDLSTSVNNPELAAKVAVFPNPVRDELYLHLNDLDAETAELFDGMGRLVATYALAGRRNVLPVKELEKGLYTLQLRMPEGIVTKRFVRN
ncbi:MAG: PKD domain-containing protein [Bacteroidota bacterium]